MNVQRTLAIELQRLSVQFRKQQKAYLNRLRQKIGPSASGASFSVLDETAGTSGREALDPEYDPGFNEIQVPSVNTNTKLPVVLAARQVTCQLHIIQSVRLIQQLGQL